MARHDRLRPVGSLFGGVSPLRNHEPARSELFVRGAIGCLCGWLCEPPSGTARAAAHASALITSAVPGLEIALRFRGISGAFALQNVHFVWSRLGDLNPGPTHYECVALPLS